MSGNIQRLSIDIIRLIKGLYNGFHIHFKINLRKYDKKNKIKLRYIGVVNSIKNAWVWNYEHDLV